MNVGAKVWIQDKDDAWVQAMVATRSGGGAEALKLTMTLENVAPPETRELILKLGESESESDKIKLRNIFDREEGASPPAHRTMNRLAAESVRGGGAGFTFAKCCTRALAGASCRTTRLRRVLLRMVTAAVRCVYMGRIVRRKRCLPSRLGHSSIRHGASSVARWWSRGQRHVCMRAHITLQDAIAAHAARARCRGLWHHCRARSTAIVMTL